MYKLLRPKSTYAMLYDASFQMRYDLARRAARRLRRSPRATFDSVLGELLVRQPADATLQRATERDDDGETWTSYTERDVLACKETLCDMCLREMVHLRRRSAQFVAALTRKPCVDERREARDEFVMCPHTDVVDVNEEDLMRIYGEPECATCADAPARRTIEMGLERADREEWTRHVSAKSSTFGADASLIEEAITAWQVYATHTDLLNAPVVAFDAFMRALMSPPSQMSWALFPACTAAHRANHSDGANHARHRHRSAIERGRRGVKRLSRYESPLHVHSWPDITRNLIESAAYKMDVKLADFRASALMARGTISNSIPECGWRQSRRS